MNDVIDYVHHKMYKVHVTNKEKLEEEDSNSEGEEMISVNEREDTDNNTESPKETLTLSTETIQPPKESTNLLTKMLSKITEDDDEITQQRVTPRNENNADETYSESSDKDDTVPSNYMVPSFLVFIL